MVKQEQYNGIIYDMIKPYPKLKKKFNVFLFLLSIAFSS